jgi:hypothetical protein
VTRLFRNVAPEIVTLTIAGEMRLVQTTPGHPFWMRQARGDTSGEDGDGDAGGWVLAGELRPGDQVQTPDGSWATVLAVSVKAETTPIYNFEVAGNHTYYVGLTGLLVHNQSSLQSYDVGNFNNLRSRSTPGDNLDLHHAVQAHPAEQIIPGYDRRTAPAIALPNAEHAAIPNLRGPYTGDARSLLARDIRNLRQFTNAPNSSLRDC